MDDSHFRLPMTFISSKILVLASIKNSKPTNLRDSYLVKQSRQGISIVLFMPELFVIVTAFIFSFTIRNLADCDKNEEP